MKIRKASLEDLNELYTLEKTLFEAANFPLSKSSFRYHIKNNLLYTAKINNKIVGYILVLTKRKIPKIYSLGVLQEYRGKQISKSLLQKALDKLQILGFERTCLEVRCDNLLAISLYEKFGFSIKQQINSFYLDGCNAYFMQKTLQDEETIF